MLLELLSSCREWGLLTVVASLAGEHGLYMQFQQLWHMGFIAI